MNTLNNFIFLILVTFIFSMNIYGQSETVISLKNIDDKIDSLYMDYKNTFIRACFAVDEIRSYSIINVDKISSEYRNEWISPGEIISKLTLKEHKQLIDALKKFISDINDTKKAIALISKLNNWCILDMHLKLISKNYGISQSQLVECILKTNIDFSDPVTGIKITQSSHSVEQLYYISINHISSLPQKQIFTFFKQFFEVLAQS